MNHITDNKQIQSITSISVQREMDLKDKTDSSGTHPRIMTVEDTAVRLSFSDSGDLSTQLANAFSAMLNKS